MISCPRPKVRPPGLFILPKTLDSRFARPSIYSVNLSPSRAGDATKFEKIPSPSRAKNRSCSRGIKSLNLEISRCHLADYVRELHWGACRTRSTITLPHSTNQIIVFWRWRCRCRRPCSSSLSWHHQWRQRQRQRHKLGIWSVEQGKVSVLHMLHALSNNPMPFSAK